MKKKSLRLPVFVLVLAILSGIIMTFIATPYYIRLSYVGFDKYETLKRFSELQYKLRKDSTSLELLLYFYNPSAALYDGYDTDYDFNSEYYNQGAIYSEEMLNIPKEMWSFGYILNQVYSYNEFEALYVFNLYMAGDREKAKQETDRYFNEYMQMYKDVEAKFMGINCFAQFFAYLVTDPDVPQEDKNWALTMEQYITELAVANESEDKKEAVRKAYSENIFKNEPEKYNLKWK